MVILPSGTRIAEMPRIPHESNVIAITGVTDSGLRLERDSDSLIYGGCRLPMSNYGNQGHW